MNDCFHISGKFFCSKDVLNIRLKIDNTVGTPAEPGDYELLNLLEAVIIMSDVILKISSTASVGRLDTAASASC